MIFLRSAFHITGARFRGIGVLATFFLGLFALQIQQVQAQDVKLNPVVAVVDGFEFHLSDVEQARKQLPPQAQQYPLTTVYKFLLDNLVNTRIVAAAARKEGLDKQANVVAQVRRIEAQILHQTYLAERVSKAVTKEALQGSYDAYLKTTPVNEEVRARHILVQTREQALEVIGRLEKGEDFAALAKSVSTGPSGKRGGDLGYFTAGRMVPAFSEAAFSLQPGSFTEKPVKTQFGWHIIKTEDKRSTKPKSFEEVRGELRQTIAKKLADDIIAVLRQSSSIQTFGPDGK
jgi:peptidyl-prolyl cis-trans isomerase C